MTKVLEVSFGGLGFDGSSSVIYSIAEALQGKIEFEFLVFSKKNSRESEFAQIGKVNRINGYSGNILEKIFRSRIFYKELYKLCKGNNYDVIHCHNLPDAGVILKAAKKAGVKLRIVHSHQTKSTRKTSIFRKFKNKRNLRLIEKYATHKIGCSIQACRDFYKDNDYKVIYNSVDLNKFNIKNKEKNISPSFIHVGRFAYPKNQRFLLKVFKEIKEREKDASLLLIGYGNDEKVIRKDILSYGLEDNVKIVQGDNDFVAKSFAQANYMIFPSFFEGFSIVLIEAQASGCYCFASDAIVEEVDCGLMKKIPLEKDAKTWAEIILNDIKNKNLWDEEELLIKINKFDRKVITEQYFRLYNGEL